MEERKTIDLKKFRFLNGVSQSQLAAYLGVGQSFISKMEAKGYPMPQEIYDKIMSNPDWSFNIDAITKPTVTAGDHIEIKGGHGNISETSGMERKAVDAFLLSFALMGMNATDMLSCKHPIDGVIIYNRKKTCDRRADKAEMHVQIDSRIYPLFHEWAGKDDEHAFLYHAIHTSSEQFNASLAHGLQKYRNRMGIPPKGLDFYSARHTWASIAYSIGIDKSIINDCLCHVDEAMKVTDIYINKDWSVLWEANRRVLDQFDWSPLKED